jgi:hypothetical protein
MEAAPCLGKIHGKIHWNIEKSMGQRFSTSSHWALVVCSLDCCRQQGASRHWPPPFAPGTVFVHGQYGKKTRKM